MSRLQWCAAIGLQLLPLAAFAQTYPDKPVQVVVSFPPGGSIDVTARIVFDKLGARLGQEFVIDNRGGASGSIAAAYFARRPPDGYTIMAHSASHIANAHLYKGLSYDTLNDFIGVTTLARQVGVLVVHPSLPVKTVTQFIALAKRRPGEINYGSGGNGSFLHVAMALFESMARTRMVHIPYRGGSPASIALVSGEVQAVMSTLGSVVPLIQANQIRALGVTSRRRVEQFPQIPAIAETLHDFEFTAWVGCFVPAGTPRHIVDRLNSEIKITLADSDVAATLTRLTLEPMYMTPDAFAQRLRSDYEKYGRIIKLTAARIK